MIYLLAVLLASIVIILIVLAKKSYYQKNLSVSQVNIYLHALLKRGYDGGFIIIEDMNSDRFVQFAKYIKRKGDIGLQLSFPKALWSEQYYERFKEWLRSEKIPFIIRAVDSTPVSEFIEVDCRANLAIALGLVENIFQNVFQIRDPLLRIRGNNISAKDKLIDSQ